MAFESLTDSRIRELLQMPKKVVNANVKNVSDCNHDRRDYVLRSEDGAENFRLFVRQNKTVSDDFSCGLIWLPAGGGDGLILARYNGSSHEHPNRLERTTIEHACHIHTATERYIRANLKAEGFAAETDAYQTCNGALNELTLACNIAGIETRPDQRELSLTARPPTVSQSVNANVEEI